MSYNVDTIFDKCHRCGNEPPLSLFFEVECGGLHDGNVLVGCVACCGLPVLCFHVGEFGEISALHRVSKRSGTPVAPRPIDQASNEERVVERFSYCNHVT